MISGLMKYLHSSEMRGRKFAALSPSPLEPGTWNLESGISSLDRPDLDRAAAGAEAEVLAAAAEGAAERAAGELALDGEREVGGDRVSVGVDRERDRRVHGDGDSAAGGFQSAAASVAARERGLDRASRGVGVHAASGFADVDTAAGAVSVDVAADPLERDGASAGLGIQGAFEVHRLDPSAGSLYAALSLDVAQMNGSAGGLGLEVVGEVTNFDPAARGLDLRRRSERGQGNAAARSVHVDGRFRRDFDFEADRGAPVAKPGGERMPLPGDDRGRSAAFLVVEAQQVVDVIAFGCDDEPDSRGGRSRDNHPPHVRVQSEFATRLELE